MPSTRTINTTDFSNSKCDFETVLKQLQRLNRIPHLHIHVIYTTTAANL